MQGIRNCGEMRTEGWMGYRDAGPTPHSTGWSSSPPWSSLPSAPWTLWHSCQVLDAEGPWQCLSRLSP